MHLKSFETNQQTKAGVNIEKVLIDSEEGPQISSLANKMETMVMQYYH